MTHPPIVFQDRIYRFDDLFQEVVVAFGDKTRMFWIGKQRIGRPSGLLSKIRAGGLVNLDRTFYLAIKGITRNMGRSDVDRVEEFEVDLRFIFLDIKDRAEEMI